MKKVLLGILLAASMPLAAWTPTKPPTVESVKAMSYFDLLTALTENEELMLQNARHSVSDTLSVLIRIHEKRLPLLQNEAADRADIVASWEQAGVNRAATYHKDTDSWRPSTDEEFEIEQAERRKNLDKSFSKVRDCQATIKSLKRLQARLNTKPS